MEQRARPERVIAGLANDDPSTHMNDQGDQDVAKVPDDVFADWPESTAENRAAVAVTDTADTVNAL